MKIAVVGSGIAGLSASLALSKAGHEISLYEVNDYFGGHTHTVDVCIDDMAVSVDTGFLVYNQKTYPQLIKLFSELGMPSVSTDMSFSVKAAKAGGYLEWAGSNLQSVFAQPGNLLRPAFWRMLRDILRFNRQATELAQQNQSHSAQSLGDFLLQHRYSQAFRDWYLLPMAACIWSCPTATMLAFPVSSFAAFCHNHGLLQLSDRPQWQTVPGGARQYVDKIIAQLAHCYLNTPVQLVSAQAQGRPGILSTRGTETYDQVILACHSDQALELLGDASADQREILSAIRYQPNLAILHTDSSCLPAARSAWAAWNYQSSGGQDARVCVHYLLNKLQPLPFDQPLLLSLNPIDPPAQSQVLGRYDYAHPVFDQAAIEAQQALPAIQGKRGIWFAGAWSGYGFHEDGLKSGLAVAERINASSKSWLQAA